MSMKLFNTLFFFNLSKKSISHSLNRFSSSSSLASGYNFELSLEQRKLQLLARDFAKEDVIPKARHYDLTGNYPWEIVKKAWKLGLLTMHIPQKFGGFGSGIVDGSLVGEEIAYGCAGIGAVIGINGIAQTPLIMAGNEAQKKKYLGRLTEEPLVAAYCVTEPSCGSDVSAIKTTAIKKGQEYILNGRKMWITNGGVANWYFVLAKTDKDKNKFTAFIVEKEWKGVSTGNKEKNMGQRASDTRQVFFEDVIIPKENVISSEGLGFKIAMGVFDRTRPMVASAAVGLAQRALNESLKHVLKQQQAKIDQGIGFILADMAIGIEVSRLAYLKSAWQIDNGIKNSYLAAIAKCLASKTANDAASEAVQILENNGLNEDYPAEKLMRDAKIYQIYEGTSQIQKIIISRHLIEGIL